ncbi:MAG TPA: hypothetical protein VF155_08890 [Candidatus Dormibacteraeota bacterium]
MNAKSAMGALGVMVPLAALFSPVQAAASVGTGVQASPVTLIQPAEPGHSYQLPALLTINTGDETSTYWIRVQRLSKGSSHDVPAAWVIIGRNDVALQPGQSVSVPLELHVPANAASGRYFSDLVAAAVNPHASGATLGAAAATELIFTVSTANQVPGGARLPIWGALALGVAGALAFLALASRLLGVSVRIERR